MLFIILFLILLQVWRIVFKNLVFNIFDRNLLSDVIVSMVYMIIITCTAIITIRKKKFNLNFFPEKFNMKYKIFTIFVLLFFIITLIITKNYELYNILSLIYNAIITVILEELFLKKLVQWKMI